MNTVTTTKPAENLGELLASLQQGVVPPDTFHTRSTKSHGNARRQKRVRLLDAELSEMSTLLQSARPSEGSTSTEPMNPEQYAKATARFSGFGTDLSQAKQILSILRDGRTMRVWPRGRRTVPHQTAIEQLTAAYRTLASPFDARHAAWKSRNSATLTPISATLTEGEQGIKATEDLVAKLGQVYAALDRGLTRFQVTSWYTEASTALGGGKDVTAILTSVQEIERQARLKLEFAKLKPDRAEKATTEEAAKHERGEKDYALTQDNIASVTTRATAIRQRVAQFDSVLTGAQPTLFDDGITPMTAEAPTKSEERTRLETELVTVLAKKVVESGGVLTKTEPKYEESTTPMTDQTTRVLVAAQAVRDISATLASVTDYTEALGGMQEKLSMGVFDTPPAIVNEFDITSITTGAESNLAALAQYPTAEQHYREQVGKAAPAAEQAVAQARKAYTDGIADLRREATTYKTTQVRDKWNINSIKTNVDALVTRINAVRTFGNLGGALGEDRDTLEAEHEDLTKFSTALAAADKRLSGSETPEGLLRQLQSSLREAGDNVSYAGSSYGSHYFTGPVKRARIAFDRLTQAVSQGSSEPVDPRLAPLFSRQRAIDFSREQTTLTDYEARAPRRSRW